MIHIMNKLLLIVDPQYDFIDGSLPVAGAAEAMDALSDYVREHKGEYSLIALTSDSHPWNHCSFDREGGPWPVHCLQHSKGAAVWQNLLEALGPTDFLMLSKGDRADREEYSVMQNASSRSRLLEALETEEINRIDICGLAGDVCVLNTAKDLSSLKDVELNVLEQFSPCIGDGAELRDFVKGLCE